MYVKGYVETWVIILDLNFMGIDFGIFNMVSQVVQMMQIQFSSTLERMFILNPSFFFASAWSVIKSKGSCILIMY